MTCPNCGVREVTDFGFGGEIAPRPMGRPSFRELNAYNGWLWARTESFFDDFEHRKIVRRLARELLQQRTINGRELAEMIESHWR